MSKLTIEDLKKIKQRVIKENTPRLGEKKIKIIVHMGTCGIAAGAREVMNALLAEVAESDRTDISIVTAGCMGMCSSEPNVTVEVGEEEPVVYQFMDANKMRQVFKRHILLGEIQSEFALARG
ncbi:MAG TPA: (2Fe-2S) ferredoxin domain-containing protein [Desulfobacteraceae bacterium]|nr:(2Fe-2S) ferredoxin domain-containing protein [Desulfobacteraceae bacterium]HPJ67340.1 (2Fe-2S) ferredoxin domain-containing protein [Desulfobacteraceae bacterium]HPQ28179.1 (2Fe-2S) ferredoxin domain-containing protein [Desulfobacteraceae bacterium]